MTLTEHPRPGSPRPPRARTLGGLVAEMATARPEAPAVCADGTYSSFGELDARCDRAARALLAHGLRSGDAIGVLSGNRLEWLVVAVAAAKIGVCVVPLNTFYRVDELAYAIAHGDVRTVFYWSDLRGRDYGAEVREAVEQLADPGYLSSQGIEHDHTAPVDLVQLDDDSPLGPGATAWDAYVRRADEVTTGELSEVAESVSPDDLLYVIYTSGSTARPKGVRIHHGPAIVNPFHIGERQGLDSSDRSFIASPLFYGLGLIQALGATWTHGACAVLMEVFEPGRALELLERERCTVFYGLGNMTRSLVEHPDFPRRRLDLTKGVLGLGPADKLLARERLGLVDGVAIYGLTESYGLCATTDWTDHSDLALTSIGRALPGWEISVCDPATDLPVPQGTIGQILIRGHVTSGYHKDATKNREVFTPDGYFRTGDLGWLDESGSLFFHSRLSEMMKPAGINVSPLEVENLIGQLPGVGEVHVVGVPAGTDGDHVIAVVAGAEPHLTEERVIDHVRSVAAKYKAPTRVLFVAVDDLPRVASGKVPKARLRELAARELAAREHG